MKRFLTYLVAFVLLAVTADARRIHHGGAEGREYWDTASLTDETGRIRTDQFARAVIGTGTWDNFVAYLMKSTQNVGSGATVYPLGGLTTNVMTLVNGPSWGADGIDYQATHYAKATIPALASGQEVLVFMRTAPDLASVADSSNSINGAIGYYRNTTPTGTAGIWIGTHTGLTAGETWSSVYTLDADINDPARRIGTSNLTWTAGEDFTQVVQFGNDFGMWKGTTSITMDKNNVIDTTFDCAPADVGTTDGKIYFAGVNINGSEQEFFGRGTGVGMMLLSGTAQPTAAQREKLTGLFNNL